MSNCSLKTLTQLADKLKYVLVYHFIPALPGSGSGAPTILIASVFVSK